jgi:hypothetical protein
MPNDVEVEHDDDWGAGPVRAVRQGREAPEAPAPVAERPRRKPTPRPPLPRKAPQDGRERDERWPICSQEAWSGVKRESSRQGVQLGGAGWCGVWRARGPSTDRCPGRTSCASSQAASVVEAGRSGIGGQAAAGVQADPRGGSAQGPRGCGRLAAKAEAEKGAGVWGEVVGPTRRSSGRLVSSRSSTSAICSRRRTR